LQALLAPENTIKTKFQIVPLSPLRIDQILLKARKHYVYGLF